ncbi:MAG: hypothetical protein M3R17_05120 [Bacteroidota bacterium]|nr:hypothetical protein [Bacteroidota bacterium]
MAITTEHPSIFPIEGDPVICRYMDFTRLTSLLDRKALFFTRSDKQEDAFEGRYPSNQGKIRKGWYEDMRRMGHFENLDDEKIDKAVEEYEQYIVKIRALMTINCWHKNYEENALMWRSYCNTTSGIMIKSTYSKLIKCLGNPSEQIFVSEVRYPNYNKDLIPDGNSLSPFVHKQHYYAQEQEVRLLHEVSQVGWFHDWSIEESENGVYIKCDLDILIDEVIIAPHAELWYVKLVEGILDKYNCKKTIARSGLAWPKN